MIEAKNKDRPSLPASSVSYASTVTHITCGVDGRLHVPLIFVNHELLGLSMGSGKVHGGVPEVIGTTLQLIGVPNGRWNFQKE